MLRRCEEYHARIDPPAVSPFNITLDPFWLPIESLGQLLLTATGADRVSTTRRQWSRALEIQFHWADGDSLGVVLDEIEIEDGDSARDTLRRVVADVRGYRAYMPERPIEKLGQPPR